MAAMILAVSVVSLVSYELIRNQVDSHFREALQDQYSKQFDLFQKRKNERLASISNEIITNTSNPRLMAALLEGDFSRFYYDLGQELKPFYQNLEFRNSDGRMWPFFRFISADGTYLSPPTVEEVGVENAVDTLPGIMAPIPEKSLEKLLVHLRTNEVEPLDVRSGYIVTNCQDDDESTVLLEAYVCPVVDAFGLFLGDLIVVIPWQGDSLNQVNTISAIVVKDHIFTSDTSGLVNDRWQSLVTELETSDNYDEIPTVVLNDEAYVLFSRQLVFDSRFPMAQQATLFSLKEQMMLQQSIANMLVLIVAGGLGFSLLLSLGVAQGLNNPIARLKAAVTLVGQGDFTARVENDSQDEIGELSKAFNQMAEDLSTKERYKNVLSQVTDARVADRLMRGEVELGGESLEVVILFCDIRGFTDFSADMDPHDLIALVNEHMTAMTQVAYEFGGVVDKFVGDEIMVLFGAPLKGEDDVAEAFQCALKMIERRSEMNQKAPHPLEIGIGLAYGEVVAGCVGSIDRLNYTVLGKQVNLAARLCSEAKRMEIAIGDNIYEHLRDQIGHHEKREKALKGFRGLTSFHIVSKSEQINEFST